jgi:hypothetical protein
VPAADGEVVGVVERCSLLAGSSSFHFFKIKFLGSTLPTVEGYVFLNSPFVSPYPFFLHMDICSPRSLSSFPFLFFLPLAVDS